MIIIDRFEEGTAILENDGDFTEIERNLLPDTAKEGDIVSLIDGKYIINQEKTALRRSKIVDRLRKMGL
jgi:hypothetical protein